jgi:cell division protein FtsX
MHFGWAIMGTTMIAPVFIAQFEWDKEQTQFYLSLIANISLLGVMIGSLSASPIIQGGRRRAALIMAGLVYSGAAIT